MIRVQGFVSGEEFAPTHFQQRQFSFYEIPLIHLQITPIKRTGSTPATAMFLRQKTLVAPNTGPPQVWHLVWISRGLTGTVPIDANLLIDQLNLTLAGKDYWRTWSVDHPQHAKVLWPVIQTLAQRELYIVMPRLFELAQMEQTPQQLKENIDDHLRKEYRRLIIDMDAADRTDLARQLLDEATRDFPEDDDLKNVRLSAPSESP